MRSHGDIQSGRGKDKDGTGDRVEGGRLGGMGVSGGVWGPVRAVYWKGRKEYYRVLWNVRQRNLCFLNSGASGSHIHLQ
ncbi:hypothetical protein Tco_0627325 [Tanacetum coccineum]|uniref:Uncharacterized protein n=1 Tax=Tanacetum coccineum TaxID=301880 RepID=A0ABQ4WMB7_9ASTR